LELYFGPNKTAPDRGCGNDEYSTVYAGKRLWKKGNSAEAQNGCRRFVRWDFAEQALDCHMYVESYRRQFNFGISFFKACDTASGRRLINFKKGVPKK